MDCLLVEQGKQAFVWMTSCMTSRRLLETQCLVHQGILMAGHLVGGKVKNEIFEGLLVQFSKVWLPINSPLCDRNFFGEKEKI